MVWERYRTFLGLEQNRWERMEDVTKISDSEFEFQNAHCFKIKVSNIGPAVAIYYDVAALKYCCKYIEKNHIERPIVYILACRIRLFMGHLYNKTHKLGGKVYINSNGAGGVIGT